MTIYDAVTQGTPDEKVWPGVTKLPDFKSSFPKWPLHGVEKIVEKIGPKMDATGHDLLEVSWKGMGPTLEWWQEPTVT